MEKKTLVALVAAAIVVIAGAGIYYLYNRASADAYAVSAYTKDCSTIKSGANGLSKETLIANCKANSNELKNFMATTSNADFKKFLNVSTSTKPNTPTTVTVSPTTAKVMSGDVQPFTANIPVTWTATGGTIDQNGKYIAGTTGGNFKVTATSKADSKQSASASVTIEALNPAPQPTTGCNGATVYTDGGFQGSKACLTVGDYTTAALALKGIGNDSISSIKIEPGYLAFAYVDDNFKKADFDGVKLGEFGYESSIGGLGTMNDKISSIQVVKSDDYVASVYVDSNFAGANAFLQVGDYNGTALKARGIPNDSISSVKVKSGYKVTVYRDENFSGTSATYTENQGGVGGLNDRITSLKVEKVGTVTAQ